MVRIINQEENKIDVFKEIVNLINISMIELVALYYGLKPVMSELINFDKFDQKLIDKFNRVNDLCKKLNLHLAVSNCKFVVNSPRGIFEMIGLDDPRKGKLGVGISKNKNNAVKAVNLYYKKTKDSKYSREFAILHGYPKCCSNFGDYLCNEDNTPDNFGFKNPAVESLKRSKDFAWQLNVFASAPLLSHYPCHLACKKSIAIIDKIINIFDKIEPDNSTYRKKILQYPASLYWTCVDSILIYGKFQGDFRNSEIKYRKVVSKINSNKFYQSNDSKFLKNLNYIYKKIQKGNRVIMTPHYFEIYKDKKKIIKVKKYNKYVPVLVKPTK